MGAGGKDGKEGVNGCIVREFYERILFGKICKGGGVDSRLRTASQQEVMV